MVTSPFIRCLSASAVLGDQVARDLILGRLPNDSLTVPQIKALIPHLAQYAKHDYPAAEALIRDIAASRDHRFGVEILNICTNHGGRFLLNVDIPGYCEEITRPKATATDAELSAVPALA